MKSVFARSRFKSYDGLNTVDSIDLDVDEGSFDSAYIYSFYHRNKTVN